METIIILGIIGTTFVLLGLLILLYWLKIKSDKKLDAVKGNKFIQDNMQQYTTISDPYPAMLTSINDKLKNTYPSLA